MKEHYTNICDIETRDVCIFVADFDKPCKYHDRKGKRYRKDTLSPQGMCPHLYHKIYPYTLALLYGAEFIDINSKTSVIVKCSALHSPVGVKVYRDMQSGLKERIVNFLKEILILFNVHCNPLYYRVYMQITEVTGPCPYNHSKGQTFEFNTGHSPEICPAAFDTLFPHILKKDRESTLVCPDHLGKISFKLGELSKDE